MGLRTNILIKVTNVETICNIIGAAIHTFNTQYFCWPSRVLLPLALEFEQYRKYS